MWRACRHALATQMNLLRSTKALLLMFALWSWGRISRTSFWPYFQAVWRASGFSYVPNAVHFPCFAEWRSAVSCAAKNPRFWYRPSSLLSIVLGEGRKGQLNYRFNQSISELRESSDQESLPSSPSLYIYLSIYILSTGNDFSSNLSLKRPCFSLESGIKPFFLDRIATLSSPVLEQSKKVRSYS